MQISANKTIVTLTKQLRQAVAETVPCRGKKLTFLCVIFLQHGAIKANRGRFRGANAAKGA
jgi:hypothetical protein